MIAAKLRSLGSGVSTEVARKLILTHDLTLPATPSIGNQRIFPEVVQRQRRWMVIAFGGEGAGRTTGKSPRGQSVHSQFWDGVGDSLGAFYPRFSPVKDCTTLHTTFESYHKPRYHFLLNKAPKSSSLITCVLCVCVQTISEWAIKPVKSARAFQSTVRGLSTMYVRLTWKSTGERWTLLWISCFGWLLYPWFLLKVRNCKTWVSFWILDVFFKNLVAEKGFAIFSV